MSQPNPTVLTFDDFVLDLSGRRLLRAGELQPLEPKAFAVLSLLAASPGQVFSREEILDAVWGHRHVTPGVLNRIMTLLRHALGEDAHTARYLHTVHGYGYRFDLPDPAASGIEAPASPQVRPEPEDPDDATVRLRTADRDGIFPRPARSWLLFGVLAIVLLGAFTAWRMLAPADSASAPVASGAVATPVLAVLPLRATGDDPRGQAFADGLSEELIGQLSRIDGLRVTSRTSSFQFRDTRLPLSDIAKRLHATHLLEGGVRQDGDRLRISLRLVEAGSDRTVWAQDFDRQLGDIFVLQRNIAYAIASALQLHLGKPVALPSREDPALYRRYLLARHPARDNLDPGSMREAESEIRDLLREHPDYARAWGGLASILWVRSLAAALGRDELRAEAEAAAARALELDPHQPDAHSVLARRACRLQEWAECMTLSRRAIELAPSDPMFRGWHAASLATMGYVDQALREADEALAVAPFDSNTHFLRGRLLDTLGRHDEAEKHLLMSDPERAQTALYFNAIWRKDYDVAERVAASLPNEMPWRGSELAAVAALKGRRPWDDVTAAIATSESHPLYGQVPYDFTRLLLPVRDYRRDIEALDGVQRSGYASYQLVFWQPESRALRQDPAFQDYLSRSGLLAYWREHGFPTQCVASGARVNCD
ncbi:winged helix-turn-helix domain-containing protein [Lysobacter niastensis]|uniref:Winged helix-turn-helix domain-containing protein n=1 Tax=Lysobacter niastensis TaxID=380629 RepID=A0ABS0B6F0_9GAMM|nr:winged helix-turn-helix domain-containing protein [Lysobacter niastensis]MBF6023239.1 winged helix-turn-helix domain-containing protein [Lysobacter niastensis]